MKLLLIEDHPIVRAGCLRVLQQREGLQVLEAETAARGLALTRAEQPDMIVLDLNLPDRRGLDVLAELHTEWPSIGVIVLSMYEEVAFVTSAMEAGARGYVTKNDDPDCLFDAIDAVAAGQIYLSRTVEQRLAHARIADDADPTAGLTSRERRLLDLLAQGKTLAEAAGDLGVSYRTTAEEAARLRGRLRLRTNAALIKFAVERTAR